MTLYVFHGRRSDGVGSFMDTREFAGDAAARAAADAMLREHLSCVSISVYDGEREVCEVGRAGDVGSADGPAEGAHAVLPGWIDPAISVIATRPDGTVVHWSPGAEAMYGWPAEEALRRNILDLTPAMQSRAEAAHIMRQLQAGLEWQGEIPLRGRDRLPFVAFVADFPVGDVGAGRGLIVGASVRAKDRRRLDRQLDALRPALHAAFHDVEAC